MIEANSLATVDIMDIVKSDDESLSHLNFFNDMLLRNFNPDINGYTLLFFTPPPLSGLKFEQKSPIDGETISLGDKGQIERSLNEISKFITFAAVDFSSPQEQLNSERVSSRSGGIPYATEYTTSEQMSVSYLDDSRLTIYNFHQVWIHYIWDLLEGKLAPDDKYLTPVDEYNPDVNNIGFTDFGNMYGAIDYAGSFYVVKYKQDLKTITYIGKCIGCFPQALPSKELIGQRTTNELTMLPFQYFCAAYRGEVISEHHDSWILTEFKNYILSKFNGVKYGG